MATIEVHGAASITIPADYLDDARRALIVEIDQDADALAGVVSDYVWDRPGRADLSSSARILYRNTFLLDQILEATEDTTVESVRDQTSDPIAEMLGAMVRVLSQRLERVSPYGPVPMRDVLDIAERLRWAAEEAIRICPDLDQRLTAEELRQAA